jgi:hypothetical protein
VGLRVRWTWRFLRSQGGDPLPFLEGVNPYHGTAQATGRSPRQRFSPIRARFGAILLATDCYWLRPLGSIKAPSLVVFSEDTGWNPCSSLCTARRASFTGCTSALTFRFVGSIACSRLPQVRLFSFDATQRATQERLVKALRLDGFTGDNAGRISSRALLNLGIDAIRLEDPDAFGYEQRDAVTGRAP